jgi:hypothetical protein
MNDARLSDAAVMDHGQTSTKPAPKTLAEMLKTAQRPTELVPVCLRADVLAEIRQLEILITERADSDNEDARLAASGDGPTAVEMAEQIRELEKIAGENTVYFTMQAVDSDRWNTAMDQHTSGEGADKTVDVNAAIKSILFESILSPEVAEADVTAMLKLISDGQWSKIAKSILDLNRTVVNVPKSLTASMTLMATSGKRESDEK